MKVRFSDFWQITRARTSAEPVDRGPALAAIAVGLVRGVLPLNKAVRLLGVTVSGFGSGEQAAGGVQTAFGFDEPKGRSR